METVKKEKQNVCFIVFCQPHKTPNGSEKKGEIKREGCNSTALLEALAEQFIRFGKNYVRPRHFQAGWIRGPGRG